MKIPAREFKQGINWITKKDVLPWDDPRNVKMDFMILLLDEGDSIVFKEKLEKAILLMKGKVEFACNAASDGTAEMKKIAGPRASYFNEDPWCFHCPSTTNVTISSLEGNSELAIVMTPNERQFAPHLYVPEECQSEMRGKGTMQETSTRIVRTIFDKSNAPDANLVLGEVINYPGKWSSYPPHHHPQPEIYHYRFLPEQGFGFSMLGEDAVQVKNGDTVLIFDVAHSQTSAPGYAMYYIWPIRHLDGNPYGADYGTPIFDENHAWVMDETNQGKIWPDSEKN